MDITSSQKKTVRHQFDSFCRKILREEARDYIRHIKWISQNEVSISELHEEQLRHLFIIDEYPSELFHFQVKEFSIAIKDEKFANAIKTLSNEKRDIVLLSYFLNMTDQEIADKLDMMRYTVQRRRTCSLKEIRQKLEVNENDK